VITDYQLPFNGFVFTLFTKLKNTLVGIVNTKHDLVSRYYIFIYTYFLK